MDVNELLLYVGNSYKIETIYWNRLIERGA